MENRKLLQVIILLILLIIPIRAFGYGIDTHSFLTDETIDFYNKHFERQIPDNLGDFLIDGSRHEESFPRPLNHFYDPVENRGLETVATNAYPSPVWAVDSEKQNEAKYKITAAIASILTVIKEGRISALTTETDFTWERAKKFYLQGDKAKAMYLLGHTLHLIQDASVPAKTRNDLILRNDEKPYELWTKKFTLETRDFTFPRRLAPKEPFILSNLQSYFYELASYSNNNFFSKNTIGIQSYGKPTSDVLEKDQGEWFRFGYNKEFGKYHLIKEENPGNHNFLVNFERNLILDDKHDLIFRDYWSLLSTKAVQHGAGMIDLFFREVKAIKDNPSKLAEALGEEEKKSFLGKVVDVIKKTFTSGEFEEAEKVSLLKEPENGDIPGSEETPMVLCSFDIEGASTRDELIINEVAWMGDKSDFRNEWIELKNISGKEIDISGYQVIDKKEQIQFIIPPGSILSSGGFYLVERDNDVSAKPSTDSVYKGALSNSDEGLKIFDKSCELIDEVFAEPSWPAGDNETKQTMERAPNLSWHDSFEAGGTPKEENSIVEPELEPTVSVDKKKLKPGEVIYENGTGFTTENTAVLHFILPDGREVTDSIVTNKDGSFEKIYTMPEDASLGEYTYFAVDEKTGIESNRINYSVVEKSQLPKEKEVSGKKESESEEENISYQSCNYETDKSPSRENLIINEIAWMGDNDDWRNEWIELKNISGGELNLAGYQLIDKDNQIHITFSTTTIPAGGFALLERGDESAVPRKTADIIYEGSLKNEDEGLHLFNDSCNLLDEALAEPKWIEGNNSSKKTMERKDNLEWQTSDGVGGTPGEENSIVRAPYRGGGGSGSSSGGDSNNSNKNGAGDEDKGKSLSYPDILISEIQTASSSVYDEFIELYNTSSSSVDLTNWALKKKTSGGTEGNLVSRAGFLGVIPGKGYFLIAPQASTGTEGYTGMAAPDLRYSGATYSVASHNTVLLYNPNDELSDKVGFGLASDYETATTTNPGSGRSISRSSETDTDNNFNDFILSTPSPNNSETSGKFIVPEKWTEGETETKNASSTEIAPTSTISLSLDYNSDNLTISFDWEPWENSTSSTAEILYKIKEYSSPGTVIFNSTTIGYSKKINEVGRDYNFSLQAFRGSEPISAITTSTISVPSLINNFYVYKRNTTSTGYLAEFYYPEYPFIPDLYQGGDNQTRKMMVLYLNKEPPAENSFILQGGGYGWKDLNDPDVVYTKFKHCTSGEKKEKAVLFPDVLDLCTNSGTASAYSLNYEDYALGEDNHLFIELASSVDDLNLHSDDYFTVAFYAYNKPVNDFGFKLVAVDKKKYHFQTNPLEHENPVLGNLNTAFDGSSKLTVNWPQVTDPDTIDSQLTYEINYTASSTELNPDLWKDIGSNVSNKKTVVPEDNFLIGVRAKDDFGNYSNIATTTWKYPESSVVFSQREIDSWTDDGDIWGTVNHTAANTDTASFQNLKFSENISFNKAVVKLKQLDTNLKYAADIRLSVLNSTSSSPDFQNVITELVKNDVLNPDKDLTFSFDNSISFQAGKKYWLVLDVAGPQDAFFEDEWTNAVKTGGDAYPNGKAGKGRYKGQNSSCSEIANDQDQCAFNGNYDLGPADWYLELRSK